MEGACDRSSGKFLASPLKASPHTCEPCGTGCQQMAESQTTEGRNVCFTLRERNTFSLRPAAVNRRHSTNGTLGGHVDSDRFHPYHRQFSDGVVPASSYPELSTLPVEPSCFLSQSYPSYSSMIPLQQVSPRLYHNNDQVHSSKYSLQSLPTQSQQESNTQPLFPKPIYSYSILIFLALRNSKTGSLPVSEIYSFMTEHFPYFKSAPDGWKNSVRHNLSLNKCFVKVENKNGNSSRKGCLWALNPAKVEKMQEELHKWRRKDPVTVRRSMAKPESLDRLLGERPNKLRSLSPYTNPAVITRAAPLYGNTSSLCSPAQLPPSSPPLWRLQYSQFQPQQHCYRPPATAHPSNSSSLYSPCGQQPAATFLSVNGSLHSPMAGKMPPAYSGTPQAEYSSRSMQDLLVEGDASYDIDTLNPSLSDLQLQGYIWEELQDDSLVPDPQVTPTTSDVQTSCLQPTSPVGQLSEGTGVAQRKAEFEDGNTDRSFDGYLNGLHPAVYSGVESLAGYLTSCTASIS
ncbi:forkhead box protein N1 [Pseudochaenichthys georgianus]|uniref:forkhead box protein N1 n=1 Tax=Pseudochaenichthys georgianus TaxID=52239 RepID=UPI0039C32B86